MLFRTLWVSVFLLTLCAFVQHLALWGYLRDSGELTAAAALLGVPHETGFPLYCLLGQALRLLPLGEVATRLALLSALSGAAACATVAALVARLLGAGPGSSLGGAAAGLLLAASATYLKAAAVPEVYAPTAAALGLGLWLLAGAAEGQARAGAALALLLGLGLGLHASLRLLLGPLLLGCCARGLLRGQRWPLLAPPLFLVGALLVAYLPLRAARETLVTWGEAHTLPGLAAHLSAARIRDAYRAEILTPDVVRLAHRTAAFTRQVAGQLGPAAALGLLGLLGLARRRSLLGLGLLGIAVGDVLYAAWVNPMGIADLQNGVPCALALCIGAGWALGALTRRCGPLLGIGCAALALAPAALADRDVEADLGSGVALRWARGALGQLPPRGLLLSQSDDLSATVLYEQAVAGDRPDVTVLVRQLVWDGAYTARQTARGPWLPASEARAFRGRPEAQRVRLSSTLLRRMVQRAPGRVGWEPSPEEGPPAPYRLGVPLLRLGEAGPLPAPAAVVDEVAELFAEPGGAAPRDPFARTLGARALLRLAEVYLAAGDGHGERAGALLDVALQLDPAFDAAEIALGVLRARGGDLPGALAAAERVLARDPDHATAHLNAARYLLRLGQPARAAWHAQETLRLRPGHAGAQALLGQAAR